MSNEMGNQSRDDTHAVTLPDHVVEEIEDRIDDTRFESVDAYAAFALELLLRRLDRGTDTEADAAAEPEPSDTEEVRERLESLGYL